MNTMYYKSTILLLALGVLTTVDACYKSSCTPTPSHYEELGCTPNLDEDRCCPISYTCPERLENGPDIGCQYRGKIYKVGEKIKEQFLPKRCDSECTCEHWKDENTYQFSCRGISKEELQLYEAENVLERVVDSELDEKTHLPIERCKGVAITDTDALIKNKKVKCTFEGDVYSKGQRIQPPGTCYECICDEKIKNTNDLDLTRPQCQRKQCAIGIDGEEHDALNQGCAPIYDKTATTCCPIGWRCPTSQDIIKKSGIPTSSDPKGRCHFGDLTLSLLDHLTVEEGDNLNCKCYTPPIVHCMKA